MRTRIVITLIYGGILGLWVYGDLDSVDFWGLRGVGNVAHATVVELAFAAFTILAGFGVRRWWVPMALLVPLLSLGYAQANGERGFDGGAPLTSPSGISGFFWYAAFLLLGVWLGGIWERHRGGKAELFG